MRQREHQLFQEWEEPIDFAQDGLTLGLTLGCVECILQLDR